MIINQYFRQLRCHIVSKLTKELLITILLWGHLAITISGFSAMTWYDNIDMLYTLSYCMKKKPCRALIKWCLLVILCIICFSFTSFFRELQIKEETEKITLLLCQNFLITHFYFLHILFEYNARKLVMHLSE